MSTPVQRALSAMRAGSKRARGQVVVYSQGGVSFEPVAVPARSTTEVETENSVLREEKFNDFLIDKVDLPVEPSRGDTIVWDGRTFLVTHPSGGRVYDYHDNYGDSYRIHSLEVPAETVPVVDTGYGTADGDMYGTLDGTGYSLG